MRSHLLGNLITAGLVAPVPPGGWQADRVGTQVGGDPFPVNRNDGANESPGAVFAAAIAGVALPFVFYAKLANVDAPYVFWFAWSHGVLHAHRHARTRCRRAVVRATAATAVETKDQAYGFFVLPVLHLALTRRRVLPIAIAGGLAAFLLESNVLFTGRGFVEHIRAVADVGADLKTGPDS